jgi:sugar phosphate permease
MNSQTVHTATSRLPGTADLSREASASLRKRWLYLLPVVFVTYSLAYLDRANYGFGAAAGLSATLHITDKQMFLLSGLFFLGYFAFQLPGAAFARKRSASLLVFAALIAWGTFAALTGVIRQFWLLSLDRLLLGVAESLIFPAMLILLTRWFTREERSRANSILILGNPVTVLWMSIITGYLIQSFGWQKTFIIEGIPSILWAFVWVSCVSDKPLKARWMTSEAAEQLERALTDEQVSVSLHSGRAGSVREALLRKDVLLLSVQYFFWSLGIYGFVLWLPTIVKQGSSLSMGRTGLLSAIPYLAAILLMLVVSYISDKTQSRKSIVWPFLLIAGVSLFGSFVFAEKSFPLAFACLVLGGACMYAPYGPFFAIIPERLPRSVTAEVLAMINSCGALGGFFGSYFVGFLRSVTGNSRAGFLLMSLSMVTSAILLLCLPPLPSADQLEPSKMVREV